MSKHLGFDSSSAVHHDSAHPSIVTLAPFEAANRGTHYSMNTGSGKPELNDVSFQGNHSSAYSHGAPYKKSGTEVDRHSMAQSTAQMDPNLTGSRRHDGGQSGYGVRQDQAYRLDLLQTDPNLESGEGASDQDHVTRAFPFLSNSIGTQESDGRQAIFPPNFSGVAHEDAYKKVSESDGMHGMTAPPPLGAESGASMHSKSRRDSSYDSTSEKKDTPYSRSPSLRVTHKIAERKRRKEMKELFDELKEYVPVDRGPKTSKGDILTKAVLQFQTLHREREHLIEALEAAHHELNQLRQVAGGDASGNLQSHVYPHSSNAQYLSRSSDARLHGGIVGAQDQHVAMSRDKSDGAQVGLAQPGTRNESFLLDRLRQGDEGVHPSFKQLDQSAGVLDQSLGAPRPFQPEYQSGLDLNASSEAASLSDQRTDASSRQLPREGGSAIMSGASVEGPTM
ncbi:hypothetical protein MVES1_002159 [Malassezia vespertilionis]|uniref:BHLH domain-containing protein n=1 Tax=Malassezia vespertilionis TaxID=2020962 RepID=A0A2N1JC13_9BASI|nr:uncharacterized protein MVES1_002159 [Malassezia vespertilionis]PKI84100.1 hypothetical protein MVES_002037 [Malassezia vespertilionis]WFD06805.1 hypothetical protein MVES1_002159 [Malassezia vespertilionis]